MTDEDTDNEFEFSLDLTNGDIVDITFDMDSDNITIVLRKIENEWWAEYGNPDKWYTQLGWNE